MTATVFTIGHSRHAADHFGSLLLAHTVELLVDVRSKPCSRWSPQYNQTALARFLGGRDIDYVYLGTKLGGRPADRTYYREDGSVDFARRALAADFKDGIQQLIPLALARRTVILCAEEDPAKCHRRLLVGSALVAAGLTVVHVRGDAHLEPEVDPRPTRQTELFG